MKVLVLGATGMLGHVVLRVLHASGNDVVGSVRSPAALALLPEELRANIVTGVDVENVDSLVALLARTRPQAVINCIGLVKQLDSAGDPLAAIPVNALLPHRLASLCALADARLVHISTDCVFAGSRGQYTEDDPADAQDLYGRSKHMGEVDYQNAVTLRTSIIGPELAGAHGLVGWFLSQPGPVRGFARAFFSGLPTVELATVIRDHVLPNPSLRGVFHVSADRIDKDTLLRLCARAYGRDTQIVADEKLVIDRSLDSTRFRQATGYVPKPWPELVQRMAQFG